MTGLRQLSIAPSESAPRLLRTGRRILAPGFLERLPFATVPSAFPCGSASVLARTSHSPLRASVPSLSGRSPSSLAGFRFATRASLPLSRASGIPSVPFRCPLRGSFPSRRATFHCRTVSRPQQARDLRRFGRGNHPDKGNQTASPRRRQWSGDPPRLGDAGPFRNSLFSKYLCSLFSSRCDPVNTEPPRTVATVRRRDPRGFVGDQ